MPLNGQTITKDTLPTVGRTGPSCRSGVTVTYRSITIGIPCLQTTKGKVGLVGRHLLPDVGNRIEEFDCKRIRGSTNFKWPKPVYTQRTRRGQTPHDLADRAFNI